jgi:hypothetical protein
VELLRHASPAAIYSDLNLQEKENGTMAKQMRTRLKKLLAVTLAVSMTMSLLNVSTLAAGGEELTVEVGSTLTLEDKDGITGEPEEVETVEETSWNSSDETIATVDAGTVTGVGAGTVEITRTSYAYRWTNPEDPADHAYYDLEDITDENRGDIQAVKSTTSWSVTVTDPDQGPESPDFGVLTDSGEGWEWYGETSTLVLTEDTGDFAGSGSTAYPWGAYLGEMVSLYAENISIGENALYATANRPFTKLEQVTFVGCTLSPSAFDGGTYNSRALRTMSLLDCTLTKDCIKNTDSLTNLVLDNCGDIPEWAFQNLDASSLNLTITGSGTIGGDAFYHVSIESLSITGYELGWTTEEWEGNVYHYSAFDGIEYLPDATLTLDSLTVPESYFEWCAAPSRLTARNCTIGADAFGWANQMPSVITLEDCQVESGAFAGNNDPTSLTTLSITGGTVGGTAFSLNSSLSNLTMDGVEFVDQFAFSGCDALTSVSIQGPATVGNYAFGGCDGLTSVELDGEVTLEQRAFAECPNITTFTLKNTTRLLGSLQDSVPDGATLTLPEGITWIDRAYFVGCLALKGELDLTGVKYIGPHAFNGCTNITKLIVDDDVQMGYSTIFPDVIDNWDSRVAGILDGQFQLEDASAIDTIAPDGWTSAKVGGQNSAESYDGDTQITKEAKWHDEASTVADVQIKAYYTAQQQMDFVFVLDCTDSMSVIGDPGVDQYAKFYDMQSKLLDVSQELLSTPGYDCQVAFVGYGAKDQQYFNSGFLASAPAAQSYIQDITSFQSLTNLSLGLAQAQALAESNTAAGRDTTVVLISDGTPNNGTSFPGEGSGYYGYTEAAAIQATGTKIFGVLHAMSAGQVDPRAEEVMDTICDDYFASYDTQGFSQAVNDAISAAYGEYVLVDTVHPDFDLDPRSIQVSSGSYVLSQDQAGNDVITWTISGMPFTVHTMTFQEKLKQVDGKYPVGNFDTNASDAPLTCGGTPVNAVVTPVLPRDETVVPPSSYQLKVHYLEEETEKVLADPYSKTYSAGLPYDATALSQKEISGYTFTRVTGDALTGTMDADKEIIVWYKAEEDQPGGGGGGTTKRYDLVVRYLEEGTEKVLAEAYSTTKASGTSYDVTDRSEKEIDGYLRTDVTGDPVKGTMDADKEIIVWYVPEEDIEEPETPTTETPENPEEPGTDVPDPDVPTTDLPEEEVPKAEVPATGDASLLWLAAAALSGTGLAWLALSERKGKREE